MKKYLRYLKKIIVEFVVALDKQAFFYAVRSSYKDSIVRRLNEASDFKWSEFKVNGTPTQFSDLLGLFYCTPLNRGILRQDFDEAMLLYETVSSIGSPHGVEIGRFYGGSTVLLATAVGAKGKLVSIDLAPKNDDKEVNDVLRRLDLDSRVKLIIDNANNVELDKEFDFVFVDGDHSYEGARLDHNKWGSKVKKDGFVIHHDMGNTRPHSVQWNDLAALCQDIKIEQEGVLELYGAAGSMVVFRRTGAPWVDIIAKKKLKQLNISGQSQRMNTYLDREKG